MDTEHPAENEALDELDYEQSEWDPVVPAEPAESRRLREMRVDDYEITGLENPDALGACLAAVNADLFRISSKLGEVIQQSLSAEPVTTESVRRVEAVLNDHLRVTRQIDRFAQLEIRATEARQNTKAASQDWLRKQRDRL